MNGQAFNPSTLQNATSAQLQQAAANNHCELFCMSALALDGEVKINNGLTWTYCGANNECMIPFPSLDENNAGAALDEMMAYYRAHPPKSAGCWSLAPSQPADLEIRLLSRGFQPGWKPCWMALDLETIKTDFAALAGLQIRADNTASTENIENLPYAGNSGAVSIELMQARPERAQRFLAVFKGEIVGQSCIFFSTGNYAVAGIYNVGVVPEARKQGIGKAVVIAACLYAKEQGYRYAVLNGTGRRMYEQVGFQWIGNGLTWWLMNKEYRINPPTQNQVALAEAVGKGDITALHQLSSLFSADDLNTPIANGMTLMQLSVHCRQTHSAEWLLQHGANYTVLDAWDFGWKDLAISLLKTDHEQVNKRYGDHQATLLHIAAERDDITLAQLVLSAKPDLEIKDKIYDGTALDWAQHLRRNTIVELIKNYEGRQ